MSGNTATTSPDSEQYYYQSCDPHSAIPDWVPFAHQLSAEARNLITATLILQKRGKAPTRRELAHALSVDERSIYRWLTEIASAGAMSSRRAGRRRLNVFHRPKPDQALSNQMKPDYMITDRLITDQAITDHVVRFRDSGDQSHEPQQSLKTAIPDQAISDPSGGGGDHVFRDSDPPPSTTPRRKVSPVEITGAVGRWMVAEGFSLSKAYQHQDLPLAPAQADYQRRRQLGQGHGAIALAWEVAPPAGDSSSAPLEPIAGEFTFSEREKERYRAMGFAIGDELVTEESK